MAMQNRNNSLQNRKYWFLPPSIFPKKIVGEVASPSDEFPLLFTSTKMFTTFTTLSKKGQKLRVFEILTRGMA